MMSKNDEEESNLTGFCICAIISALSGVFGFFYFGGYVGLWALLAAAIPFALSGWGVYLSRQHYGQGGENVA